MKVLVVDDHALFRAGLISLFNSQPDFKVIGEAGNIREAIDQARALEPDLILMDLGLPDGSGIEAMDKILEMKPETKIVFLTIHESDEMAFTAIRHGAKGFLIKNIPVAKLLAALRALDRGELAISRVMLSYFLQEGLRLERKRLPGQSSGDGLTMREFEVLTELSTGVSNQEIARRLYITENTVKAHVHNILDKLKLNNRREAANFARRHSLIRHFPIPPTEKHNPDPN
jgi:two-component system NarL family response regulator